MKKPIKINPYGILFDEKENLDSLKKDAYFNKVGQIQVDPSKIEEIFKRTYFNKNALDSLDSNNDKKRKRSETENKEPRKIIKLSDKQKEKNLIIKQQSQKK